MLLFLSSILFILFMMLGYYNPKKMGWAVIILVPILGPAEFTVVPSMTLPLTAYRIAIAISIGIFIRSKQKRLTIAKLFNNKVFIWILIFILTYTLSAIRDRPKSTLFTFIPEMIFPIIIAAFTIESEDDLKKLTNIFVFQAVFISIFIMIEYFYGFNISVLLTRTKPTIDEASLWSGQVLETYKRSGYYRMSGIDGHPVYTGYRMAFLFPIILWYMTKKRVLGASFVLLAFIALLFLQTRMAIIAVLFSIMLTPVLLKKKLAKYVLMLFVLFIILYQVNFIRTYVKEFWYDSFQDVTYGTGSRDMEERYNRIPLAIKAFRESPITGYGSTYYVLYKVMPLHSNDIPAPIMYLVAAGIFSFIAYILIFIGMLFNIYKLSNKRKNTAEINIYFKYMFVAFFAGFLVLCANTVENHVIIMLMLYTAIIKVGYMTKKTRLIS